MPKHNAECIPYRTIARLPRYRTAIADAFDAGHTRVSSSQLATLCGVTASQLRQDLGYFGSFGQQGYGYDTAALLRTIDRILGIDESSPIILVGVGRLGKSLLAYPGFDSKGFHFVAAFDPDPALVGTQVSGITVGDVIDLEQYLEHSSVDIAALTVPKEAAQPMAERLVKAGIRGIWNFAPTQLQMPANVVVEHVHLSHSLLTLAFQLRPRSQQSLGEFED